MKSTQNTVLRLWIELTKSVTYIYGKAKLTWFEEIFEEYYSINVTPKYTTFIPRCERDKHFRYCQEGKKRVQCNKIKGGLE